jgi:ribosomal protein S18 acetylase RimI-like enzyme
VSSTNDAAKHLYLKLGFVKFEESLYLTADIDSLIDSEKAEEIQVRDFKKLDEDAVYELIKHSRDPKSLEVVGFQKKDLRTPLWDRIARLGTVRRIVAVQDEKTTGYASVSYTSNREAGQISSLAVLPKMISMGIAEELVKAGANYVKSCGTKTILVVAPLRNEELAKTLENLGLKRRLVFEGMVSE